jgi:hypothetical protein
MTRVYILNFGHPLHPSVVAELSPATEVRVKFSLNLDGDVVAQVSDAVDDAAALMAAKGGDLDGTCPVVAVLPGITEGAALVLAELHGRLGDFPRVLQLRRRGNGTFGMVGVLDLQKVRLAARGRR